MTWTQPLCDRCWANRYGELRAPVRLREPDTERCCVCGTRTTSGIYARINPATVPYPREDPQ